MIELFTTVFDLDGARSINAIIEREPLSRRSRRVPTLDGGAVLSDLGFSAKDTTFDITISRASKEITDWLTGKLAVYSSMALSCEFGAFLVLLSDIVHSDDGETTFTAEVLEELFT